MRLRLPSFAGAVWIPRAEVGPLRRCNKTLSQQLLPADWHTLLRLHFEQLPCPADSALLYWAPPTSVLSKDYSEGYALLSNGRMGEPRALPGCP